MYFEIIDKIGDIETIAVGGRIRDIMRLRRQFGHGNWRKLKGTALVRLANGNIRRAELNNGDSNIRTSVCTLHQE